MPPRDAVFVRLDPVFQQPSTSTNPSRSRRLLETYERQERLRARHELTERVCWQRIDGILESATGVQTQCSLRHPTLESAQRACEELRADFCGGITRDSGITCGTTPSSQTQFHLRLGKIIPGRGFTSWIIKSGAESRQGGHAVQRECKQLPIVSANASRMELLLRKPRCCFVNGVDEAATQRLPPIAPRNEPELVVQQKALACRVAADRSKRLCTSRNVWKPLLPTRLRTASIFVQRMPALT